MRLTAAGASQAIGLPIVALVCQINNPLVGLQMEKGQGESRVASYRHDAIGVSIDRRLHHTSWRTLAVGDGACVFELIKT